MPAFDTDGELTLPESPDSVSIITVRAYVPGGEMQVALVNRKFLKFSKNKIPENVDKHGVYVLLSNIGSNGHYKAYAGRSSKRSHGGMMQRLKDHSKKKDWWTRAILFTTKNEDLTTSSIERAEDDLIKKLETMKYVEMDNDEPGAKLNLSTRDEKVVERVLEIVLSVLWIYGYNTEAGEKIPISSSTSTTEPGSASTPRPKPSTVPGKPSPRGVKLKHLFEAGLIKKGEKLEFDGKSHNPKIKIVKEGKLEVDGMPEQHNSPLKAFQAYLKSTGKQLHPMYGSHWEHWAVVRDDGSKEGLLELRSRYVGGQTTTPQGIPQSITSASSITDIGRTQNKSVSILNLIEQGHLKGGERLYPNHRMASERGYTAVLTTDGKIRPDGPGFFGEAYSSPSSAGTAILKQIGGPSKCSGWEFWMHKLADGSFERLAEVRKYFKQEPEEQQSETKNPDKKVTPLDLINGGLLEIGERLYPNHREAKERGYSAVLIAEGKIKLEGPGFGFNVHSSLSTAGEAVLNQFSKVSAPNGWAFWMHKLRDGSFEKLTEVRESFLKQNR